MTLSLSRIESAENASNDSAQSPAWSRNPWPAATRASSPCRLRTSPANTSGGSLATRPSTSSRASGSGHRGCCAASRRRHDPGVHASGPARSEEVMAHIVAVRRGSGNRVRRGGAWPSGSCGGMPPGSSIGERSDDQEAAMAGQAGSVQGGDTASTRRGRAPSYVHGARAVPLLGETIGQNLDRTAARFGDRDAVVSVHQGVRLTYAQFLEAVEEVARGLMTLGIEAGDRVGIWSPNNAEWVTLQYATAKAGAILVNINPAYRTAELAYALAQSRVSTLVLAAAFRQADYVAMVDEAAPEPPSLF